MIIKSITIANFKAIREPVKIGFKPITLLFGANSSGKSTIIHALHYAWEVIGRHNLDPNFTAHGGHSVDLGGFINLVHGHDKKRSICMRFDLDLTKGNLPIYASSEAIALTETYQVKDHLSVLHWNSKINNSKSAWIEFKVSWIESAQSPKVSSYTVGIDGEPIAGMKTAQDENKAKIDYINFFHPVFFSENEDNYFNEAVEAGSLQKSTYPFSETVNLLIDTIYDVVKSRDEWLKKSALPEDWYRRLNIATECIAKENQDTSGTVDDEKYEVMAIEKAFSTFLPLKYWLFSRYFFGVKTIDGKVKISCHDQVDALPTWGEKLTLSRTSQENIDFETTVATISQLLVGPGEILKDALSKFLYIGPIRSTVHRNYLPNKFIEKNRWADGLAAWDILHQGDEDFISQVNEWISKRLKCGYHIKKKLYKEVASDIDLKNGLNEHDDFEKYKTELEKHSIQKKIVLIDEKYGVEVTPRDIGTGITQLLPIIIAALFENRSLVAIEQPELHIHPALQVALGDLFISQIQDNTDAVYLIETHSEHFMLRLLRRIRETAEDSLEPDEEALRPNQLAVYYVEPTGSGISLSQIRISEDGEFKDHWPKGFFAERARELF